MKIDYREHDLIKLLQASTTANLPVGDIWIGLEEEEEKEEEKEKEEKEKKGGLVIERKTVKDLEASILDGRYREQRGRILSYCHQQGAQPLYIIEGPLRTKLPKETIMKFLNRLTLHYQIAVIRTESVFETAEWLKTLEAQWEKNPQDLQRTTELVQVSDGLHVQKKVNANDPKQFTLACLTQCTGVSVKMAEAIHQSIGSLSEVMKASQEEIQQIKVGTRKIGPVVSKRLWELLHA